MHSRVFILDFEEDLKERGTPFECPWEDYELAREVWADYIELEAEDDGFKESVRWFCNEYKVGAKEVKFTKDGDVVTLFTVETKPLIEALRREKKRRLEKIRKELEKADPSMWGIRSIA